MGVDMIKKLSAVLLAAALTSCATYDPSIKTQVADRITKTYDEFKKITEYKGPDLAEGSNDYVFLRAFAGDTPPLTVYQIYISDSYGGSWKFYTYAYDSNGKKMTFKSLGRKPVGCSAMGCILREDFTLTVSRSYLQAHTQSGIRFKAGGKADSQVFSIPGSYIAAFLDAVPDSGATELKTTEKSASTQPTQQKSPK